MHRLGECEFAFLNVIEKSVWRMRTKSIGICCNKRLNHKWYGMVFLFVAQGRINLFDCAAQKSKLNVNEKGND